jgi:hypothetical protein
LSVPQHRVRKLFHAGAALLRLQFRPRDAHWTFGAKPFRMNPIAVHPKEQTDICNGIKEAYRAGGVPDLEAVMSENSALLLSMTAMRPRGSSN